MVVHGVYLNAIFAKWWDTLIPAPPQARHEIDIRRAINARRTMSDDLSWLTADTPGELLPDLIVYPNFALSTTYQRLAHKRPGFLGDSISKPKLEDPKLWWLSKHDRPSLWLEASNAQNKHYQNDIRAAVPDAAERFSTAHANSDWWGDYMVIRHLYTPLRAPIVRLHDPVEAGANDMGPYYILGCDIGDVDKREVLDKEHATAYMEDIWDMLDEEQAK
ncbi:hypothetical protein BJX70DRAFT_390623 [Aspergillus crustosus]